MLNVPYGGVLGTWTSSNPKVMAVNQQGFAFFLYVRDGYDLVQVSQRHNVLTLEHDGWFRIHTARDTGTGILMICWKVYIAAILLYAVYELLACRIRES
jgi:hypothetical protein